jgi:hypothetical protein
MEQWQWVTWVTGPRISYRTVSQRQLPRSIRLSHSRVLLDGIAIMHPGPAEQSGDQERVGEEG